MNACISELTSLARQTITVEYEGATLYLRPITRPREPREAFHHLAYEYADCGDLEGMAIALDLAAEVQVAEEKPDQSPKQRGGRKQFPLPLHDRNWKSRRPQSHEVRKPDYRRERRDKQRRLYH